jgi:5-aminopentanamidase
VVVVGQSRGMERVNLRAGCYQNENIRSSIPEVIKLMEEVVQESLPQQLDLILFPELFLTGYDCGIESLRVNSLSQNSKEIQYIQLEICRKYSIAICVGYSELDDQAQLQADEKEKSSSVVYNSAILINSSGEIVLNYRKTHLWDPDFVYEKQVFTCGETLPTAHLLIPRTNEIIQIGILICFDIEFPEPARVLRLSGASVILVPTAVVDILPARCMVPCRAGENNTFIVYSNFTGSCLTSSDNNVSFCGLSGIFGPDGSELVRAQPHEIGLFTANLIGENYSEYVHRNPYFLERQKKCHLYASITESAESR